MAPALTEPVSHRQSKISSPAQASSPRPIIGDITDQSTTQTTNSQLHHHHSSQGQNHLVQTNHQTNGSAIISDDTFSPSKELNQLADSHLQSTQLQHTTTKLTNSQIEDIESVISAQQESDGPCLGPLFATHMDQLNNDQITTSDFPQQLQSDDQHQHQHQQHDQNTNDLFSAIVDTTDLTTNHDGDQQSNQLDCGNLNSIQELLAQTQSAEFQQQFQQDFLQQTTQVPSQSFDLNQVQTMDLLMVDDQSQQTSGNASIHHSSSQTFSSPMSSQMQSNFLKENAEMEQMLGDLTTTDIDLMQVLKCFESAPAGENLGDLAGGLSLFNDVDVMNIGMDDVVGTSVSKEFRAQDMMKDIEKKREKMIRDCDFMMRRLRKIQARHMSRHISEEAGGIFEYTQQLIKRKERETKSISTMTSLNQLHSDKHKLNTATSMKMLLKRIEHAATNQQSSSTSSKILLANSNSTTIDHHHLNNSNNLSSSASSAAAGSNASAKPAVITCVPAFDANGVQQLKQCSGLLEKELSIIQKSIDSDATASSSGGESADEGVTYNNHTQLPKTIEKRAAYRWARDRAKIASRWTWLLAQISDLEYRIRQHQELYYLLKKSNGPVLFDEGEPIPATSTTSDSTSQQQPQPSVNGCRNTLPSGIRPLGDEMKPFGTEEAELSGSARTRAFKADSFKKRKLLQSTNLHKISRRAARPCTIKCGCRWPVHPCLLCTGRTDPTAPRDLPDMLSTQESVALLDPCFHPILSFPEDVAQNIHIEATLHQPEWQTRVARSSTKAIIKSALAATKANDRDAQKNTALSASGANRKNSDSTHTSPRDSKKMSPKKFKLNSKKLKKSRNSTNNNNTAATALTPTGKIRKIRKNKQVENVKKQRKTKKRKNSNMSAMSSDHHEMDVSSPNGSISRSKNSSPTPTGYGYHRMHSERRNNKNSYDIDNIVIPSNMSTTIEVLSYKEIPTPKWRVISDGDDTPVIASQEPTKEEPETKPVEELPENSEATHDEDTSNEAYLQRHEKALSEERKRFTTYLKFPYSTRSRANRRIDSQADSSGANTPDPMSPAPSTPATTNIDESAPPTPQSVDANADPLAESGKQLNNNNSSSGNNGIIKDLVPPTTLPKQERRRTVSFRKGMDPREELLRRSTTPDVKDTIPPYEPLAFPLTVNTLEQMIQCMPNSYKDIINDCIDQVTADTKPSDSASATVQEQPTSYTPLIPNCKTQNTTGHYSELSMLVEDSDETESIEEDPNDPEFEPTPAKRIQRGP